MDIGIALLATAFALGLLSFHEPCTIATHTLFAARVHAAPRGERRRALARLLGARCALLVLVFAGAAAVGPAHLPTTATIAALGMTGAVYLVTRTRYLPVPHLEVSSLLPAAAHADAGVRLGLTLPACTLPLIAVTAALAAASGRPILSATAGVLFGAAFAAPTLRDACAGLAPGRRVFLERAARATPYLTAGLLWSGAVWVWRGS